MPRKGFYMSKLPPPKKMSAPEMVSRAKDSYNAIVGLVDLRVGDVLLIDRVEYFVEMVNESRARCQPLTRAVKTVTMNGVDRQMTCASGKRDVSIAPMMEPSNVLRRLTPTERIKFLSQRLPAKTPITTEATKKVNQKQDMKNKTTTVKKDRSLKGCSDAIRALDAKGMKPENIIIKIKETWPGCSLGGVMTVLKGKARKQAKEEKKAAKAAAATAKAAAKASKAPPAKKAPAKAKTPPVPAAKKKGPPAPPKAKSSVPPVPAPVAATPPAPAAEVPAEGFAPTA